MRDYLFFIFFLIFISCNDRSENTDILPDKLYENNKEKSTKNELSSQESIVGFNKAVLKFFGIKIGEKIRIDSVSADFNNDNVLDKIYSINRLSKANKDMSEKENPAKFIELGMIGNYNHLLLFDGKEKTFSSPKNIPSSPYLPLRLRQIQLSSDEQVQVAVEYRIRDAAYVNLYNVGYMNLELLFQTKIYDRLSNKIPEAYVYEINQTVPFNTFRNIDLFEAVISKPYLNEDLNTYVPQLKKTSRLLSTFFYNPKDKKYYFKIKS